MNVRLPRETRPEALEGAPLHYAPQNELGVVFLFATLAKKWRLVVDKIQAAFPDCTAYQKIGGKDKPIRIEFEFRSSSAKYHRHDLTKCDWIVCWEHDWPQVPPHLQVIELRREFGLGFNVWMMPVDSPYKEKLSKINGKTGWSVPRRAHEGDLLVFYRTRPDACISDIFKLDGDTSYLEPEAESVVPRLHGTGRRGAPRTRGERLVYGPPPGTHGQLSKHLVEIPLGTANYSRKFIFTSAAEKAKAPLRRLRACPDAGFLRSVSHRPPAGAELQ